MTTTSFLPEDYVERRRQGRSVPIMLGLFAVVMTMVGAAFVVTYRQCRAARASQVAVNAQVETAAARLDDLDKLQAKKQQMIRKAQVTAVLVERVPRQLILAELVNNKPGAIVLTDLTLDTHVLRARRATNLTAMEQARRAQAVAAGAEEVEAPPTEVSLQLCGTAPTDVEVAQYMANLSRRPLFSGLNLSYSEQVSDADAGGRKFRIDMMVNQELDLRTFEPLMVKRGTENPLDAQSQSPADARNDAPAPGAGPAPQAPTVQAAVPPRPRSLRDH